MSGELAAGALLLSVTGLAGGVWALISKRAPWPLAIAGAVAAGMFVSLKRAENETTRSGRSKWFLSGVVGSIALTSSVAVGLPWPFAVLCGVEGALFGAAVLMSGWVA